MTTLAPSSLGSEALDQPNCPAAVARATLRDIAVSNKLFGGRGAAWFGLRHLLAAGVPQRPLTLLDIGAGSGDIARYLARRAARRGITITPVGLDFHATAASLCRACGAHVVIADASAIPFRPRSVDFVLASQFLHHFASTSVVALLRNFMSLARIGVVVAEPRRTPLAATGIRVAGRLLGFHPATQHDGALSVRRSFTAPEFAALLGEAGVVVPVRRRPGFRLVAAWSADAHA
jgi:SAM-dependent methyltransferase